MAYEYQDDEWRSAVRDLTEMDYADTDRHPRGIRLIGDADDDRY